MSHTTAGKVLAVLTCAVLLAGCLAEPAPRPSPTFRPIPTLAPVTAEPAPALMPAATPTPEAALALESVEQVQARVDFRLLEPLYIPDRLPLSKITLRDLEGGGKQVRLYYAYQRQQAESSPRLLTVEISDGGPPFVAETIHAPDFGALDAQAVQVRGLEGFLYWTRAANGQPSHRLAWREGHLNLLVELAGSWAGGADPLRPHGLDGLLLMVASSLAQHGQDWQAHTSPAWRVTFSVPPGWQQAGSDAFAGPDGSARLERFEGPGTTLAQACEWEANRHPERYGPQPELSRLAELAGTNLLCSIRPDSGEGAILFASGREEPRYLILRVSTGHLLALARTLILPAGVVATDNPISPSAAAGFQASSQVWQGLTVETYRLGPFSPGSADVIRSAPEEVLQKRRADRAIPAGANAAAFKGQAITLAEITVSHPFAENRQVQVLADGAVIFRYNLLPGSPASPRLATWEDHWILNIDGMLIMDGRFENERLGYAAIRGWTLLGGKPFYFFHKDGQERISYDGVLYEVVYDQILCCGEPGFETGRNDRMAWFYAAREGSLYYLEFSSAAR